MKQMNRFSFALAFITLCFLFAGPVRLSAQNQTDKQGRKTGHWVVTYENGKTQYEADFVEGKPVGLMLRYDKHGQLTARMLFSATTDRCDAILYYPGEKKAAEGIFLGKSKDSTWNYYAEEDGSLRIRESWKNGALEGDFIRYYPNGQVSDQTAWKNGVREGRWVQYFENGALKHEGGFVKGLKEGPFKAYYPDGTPELEGSYKNDLFDGNWNYYDEEGQLALTLEYKEGQILNEDALIGKDEELLKKIEENTGNMPDPALGNY